MGTGPRARALPATRPPQDAPLDARGLVAAAFEGTDALLLVIGDDGTVAVANPAMTRATGWTGHELAARPFWDTFVAPEDHEHAQTDFARAMAQGLDFAVEGDWVDRAGGRLRVSMQLNVLRDGAGLPRALSVVGVDVTEQRREQARLRQHAETDDLTGLSNRRSLFTALRAALQEGGEGCGLLFCDLDGFKAANDRDGHHVGDLVLVEVARRLRAVADATDVVGRFGGDEFVVMRPGHDADGLVALAARVEAALRLPVATPATRVVVRVGVSIGTAVGRPGADPDDVVRAADRRMYQVKEARRRGRRA